MSGETVAHKFAGDVMRRIHREHARPSIFRGITGLRRRQEIVLVSKRNSRSYPDTPA